MSRTIVGEGTFRLDRRAALDKLERFRFTEPGRYIEELLAAALCAGASSVSVVMDANDLIVSWDADPLSPDELNTLFDSLFGQSDSPRHAMRQHLAAGLLGAHGTSPRWLHIDSGNGYTAHRIDLVDPIETLCVALDEPVSGVRIHIRDGFGPRVMHRYVRPRARAERRRIEQAVDRFPLPVWLNGVLLEPKRPAGPPLLSARGTVDGHNYELTLLPTGPSRIDWVRNGIVVGQVNLPVVGSVVGCVHANELTLNASRSEPVNNEQLQVSNRAARHALATLYDSYTDLLPEERTERLSFAGTGLQTAQTRDERLAELADDFADGPPHSWDALPILADMHGIMWSRQQVRKTGWPVGISRVAPAASNRSKPVFPRDSRERLKRLGIPATDITQQIKLENQGFERRKKQRASKEETHFPGKKDQRTFDRNTIRGSVRIVDTPVSVGRHWLTVRFQIEGVVVQTVNRPSPCGPMQAIVDSTAFATDATFTKVLDDGIKRRAETILLEEAHALILEQADKHLAFADPAALTMASHAIAHLQRQSVFKSRNTLLSEWSVRPLLRRVDDTPLTLNDAKNNAPKLGWLLASRIVEGLTPPAVAARVLLIPEAHQDTWLTALGVDAATDVPRARKADAWLVKLAHGERRRNTERQPVALPRGAQHPIKRTADGVNALFARTSSPSSQGVSILGDGRLITTQHSRLLPSLCGVIDLADAQTDTGFEKLEGRSAKQVERLMQRAADDVAVAWWTGPNNTLAPPDELLLWLARTPSKGARKRVADCTAARTWSNEDITVDTLLSKRRRWPVLVGRPRFHAFRECLLDSSALRELLRAKGQNEPLDAKNQAESMVNLYPAFKRKPEWSVPPSVLVQHGLPDVPGAIAWIPLDPKAAGRAVAQCLFEGRALGERHHWSRAGVHVAVQRPDIQPNPTFTGPIHRRQLTALSGLAIDNLPTLLNKARSPSSLRAYPETWRAIAHRVLHDANSADTLRELVLDLPIVPTTDGPLTLRALDDHPEPVFVIDPNLKRGATDDALYVVGEPGVQRLVRALRRHIADGTQRLTTYRTATANRRSLQPHSGQLVGPQRLTADIDTAGLNGRLGIAEPPAGPASLQITLLVEAQVLQTLNLPFPTRATAVVRGPSIEPTDDFSGAKSTPALQTALNAVVQTGFTLLREHRPPFETAKQMRWAFSVASTSSELQHWPVATRLDGSPAYYIDLAERPGPIPAVHPEHAERFRSAVPRAVVIPASVWGLFTRSLTLDNLVKRQVRNVAPVDPIGPMVDAPGGGRLAVSRSPDAQITLVAAPLSLTRVSASDHAMPLPLDGWLPSQQPASILWEQGEGPITQPVSTQLQRVRDELFDGLRMVLGGSDLHNERKALRTFLFTRYPMPRAAKEHGGELLDLPLWRSLKDTWVSTRQVFDAPTLYNTSQEHGDVRPTELFIRCDGFALSWLANERTVLSGDPVLRTRARGHARRTGAKAQFTHLPPDPLIHRIVLPSGATARLWHTRAPLTGVVTITVDGRLVESRPSGCPTVRVHLDGAFPTDDAFLRATVSDEDLGALSAAIDDAIAQVWREDPTQVARWIGMVDPDNDHKLWNFPLFETLRGPRRSLQELSQLNHVLWTQRKPADMPAPLTVVTTPLLARALRDCLSNTAIQGLNHYNDERAKHAERKALHQRERAGIRIGEQLHKELYKQVGLPELTQAADQSLDAMSQHDAAPTPRQLVWILATALYQSEQSHMESAMLRMLAKGLAKKRR